MQGRDVGRPPVRARRAATTATWTSLLFVVEQEGRGACHTGERSCFFRAFGSGAAPGPCDAMPTSGRRATSSSRWPATTRSCRCGARCWPTSRRRSSAFVKLVGDGEGFLLESVEHAERWGRFSFIGRDPALTFVARGRRVERRRRRRPTACPPTRARSPRSRRCSRAYRVAAARPSCRRSTAASSASSATTSCARSSACPTCPHDDLGLPDAVLSLSGPASPRSTTSASGCYLIENVYPPPGRDDERRSRARLRRRAVARLDDAVDELRPAVAVLARAAARPTSSTSCPACASTMGVAAAYRGAVEAAKEHILAGDIFQVVLAQRFDLDRSGRPVRRVPGAAAGEPVAVHVLPAPSRGHDRRLVARADGAAARRPRDQPADRGHPPPRPHRGARPAPRPPSSSSTRRSAPST